MNLFEQRLLSLFNQMTPAQQRQCLEMAQNILRPPRTYTGRELMALPAEERERLVAEARRSREQEAMFLDRISESES